jgi:membrane fusion protein (multidrug efflux system)
MQQTSLLKLDITIPERYASSVHTGDSIHFHVDGVNEELFATVSAIEPKIDLQTRNFTIRALYNNPKGLVYPGAFAKAELVAQSKQNTFMVPTESIIPELKGKKVFLCKNGKASPAKVETGVRNDQRVEIISGLNEGDTVITTGIMSLRPDMEVKIVELKK